ncbi:hypothetical protein Fcan01_20854 [Folsomia candida]|uniref:Uncharacterized protein n=1 Tax=Folsomia candida TaxID=158441 RepID=A0A226DGN4_FOLCA|nr:hypothetical protein Fcan01_20854 [Folsomia candida]
MNIGNGKVSSCRLSIVKTSQNFEIPLNLTLSRNILHFATEKHLHFGHGRSAGWVRSTKNVWVFLVTKYSRKELAGLKNFYKFANSVYVENFAIWFKLDNNDKIQTCLIQQEAVFNISEASCTTENDVNTIQNLRQPPKRFYTRLDTLRNVGHVICYETDCIDVNLVKIVFRKANATLIYVSRYSLLSPILSKGELTGFFSLKNQFVQTEFGGFEFFTCYSKKSITFHFYITPFQPWVWFGVAASTAVVIGVIKLSETIEGISETFSPWLFLLGTLLEECSPIPAKLKKSTSFRLVVGVWGIMAIFLTNVYNGLMISELNAPLAGSVIDTFNEIDGIDNIITEEKLISLDTYAELLMDIFFKRNVSSATRKISPVPTYFRLLSSPERGKDMSKPDFIFLGYLTHWYLFFRGFGRYKGIPKLITRHDLVRLALLSPNHAHWPERMKIGVHRYSEDEARRLVEKEVIQCGKSVLFQESSIIQEELAYYRKFYYWIKFQRGKETLGGRGEGWIFEREGISKIPQYFRFLVETGIYGELRKAGMKRKFEYRIPLMDQNLETKSTVSVGINGGIVTLFILWGSLLGISLLELLGELCMSERLPEKSLIPI